MKIFLSLLIVIFGCTSKLSIENHDIIDKLILVHQNREEDKLLSLLGQPNQTNFLKDENRKQYVYFRLGTARISVQTSIDLKTKKIIGSVLHFENEGDDYAYLKEKFKKYQWIETELPSPKGIDVAMEPRKVEIKNLGISFEFDNQDPYRRVLWIFFE